VEDHFSHGGMGDFIESALAEENVSIVKLAVNKISQSGKKDELLKDAGIDSSAIVSKVKEML